MIWHITRYLVSFAIPSFYKKIEGKNVHKFQIKGPVIIAMNHPNAFMDPVCITWLSYPTRAKYLARGDAFKPGIASFLLSELGVVPIFRMSDGGKEGLQKNDESYRVVNKLLKKNEKIIVFAEGLCIQERRLRPLKKGVARMVFGAYEHLNNKDLIVVPVGLNYSAPSKIRSKLFYNVGNPIRISDLASTYKENPARTQKLFLELLESRMRELVTHIKNKENDVLVVELEGMVMKDWLKRKNLKNTLENEFEVTSHLTELINNLDELEPEKTAILRQNSHDYHSLLRKNKLRDWIIDPLNRKKISYNNLIFRYTLTLLGLSVYALGWIAAYLPYKLSIMATKKVVKRNKEFYASMALGFGAFIFIFNFLAWFFLIYAFSPNVICPLVSLVVLMLAARFALLFHFFMLKTNGIARALKNPHLYKTLSEKRLEVYAVVNGLDPD
ncbi:MAG: 1-acyl-sn-glycerol-3-phosphate acyltransferase [Bacteroidota bacterium]|nr:1-acyl-sn-glycerol-3-phosphate acyltransferase [Bacteroidota bacterium]